jgi:aminoglycoside phosphotransferase family enzyme
LELRGDNSYTHRIKEEPVDYEFIEFEAVKPREIVAESTVHLDTHSSTAEKSNLEIRGDNSSTSNIKEEPVDYEFIDFQEANHNNNVTENTVQLNTLKYSYELIFIPKSKTDIYCDGNTVVISRTDNNLCPVTNLEKYLLWANISPNSD